MWRIIFLAAVALSLFWFSQKQPAEAPPKNLISKKRETAAETAAKIATHASEAAFEAPLETEEHLRQLETPQPSARRPIAADSEEMMQLWIPLVERAYEEIGISREEGKRILDLRAGYDERIGKSLDKWRGTDDEDIRGELNDYIRNLNQEFDSEMASLLGHKRFTYLAKMREQFNEDLNETEIRPRVTTEW